MHSAANNTRHSIRRQKRTEMFINIFCDCDYKRYGTVKTFTQSQNLFPPSGLPQSFNVDVNVDIKCFEVSFQLFVQLILFYRSCFNLFASTLSKTVEMYAYACNC